MFQDRAVVVERSRASISRCHAQGRGFEPPSFLLFFEISNNSRIFANFDLSNLGGREGARTHKLDFRKGWDKKAWKSKLMEWTDGCLFSKRTSHTLMYRVYGGSEPNWQLPILWKKEKLSMVPMEDLPTLWNGQMECPPAKDLPYSDMQNGLMVALKWLTASHTSEMKTSMPSQVVKEEGGSCPTLQLNTEEDHPKIIKVDSSCLSYNAYVQ